MIDAFRNGELIGIRASACSATGQVTSGTGPKVASQAANQGNYRGRNASDCVAAVGKDGRSVEYRSAATIASAQRSADIAAVPGDSEDLETLMEISAFCYHRGFSIP